MEGLTALFVKIWLVFQTPIVLPWIGTTTPLYMMIFLALLGYIVDFINGMWGNEA